MPLYEYECTVCHRHTEKIQKFSDPEITTCPHCAGTLQRVITAPAIAFKGGGWYADGYGNAKPATADSKSDAKPDSATKTDTAAAPSTESKPASSTESASTPAPAPTAPAPAAKP